MRIRTAGAVALIALVAVFAGVAEAKENPCAGKAENPCAKAENPCNPCGKAENPCNPCGKADNPCNPCGKASNPCGKAEAETPVPALNPCYAKRGIVFTVKDPMKRDTVSFLSSAPLEDILGTTSEVYGYIVFDPRRPERGVRGDFRIPVASLNTGIPLRDEHMRGEQWLDAGKHPDIRLRVDGTEDVKLLKRGKGFMTYEMTVKAVLSLHGRSSVLTIPVRVSYLAESERTRQRLPGDLLAARARFTVSLSHFGVKGFEGVLGSKVSDQIEITIGLMASNALGEKAMNPCNPCAKADNPCGGKAMNPCNPCAKAANPCAGKR